MKITIENTTKIVNLDGVQARVWEGKSESGIPVICFITRIAVPEGEGVDVDHSEFRRELSEQRTPSPDVEILPFRLIL